MTLFDLTGKVAIVTGSTKGIGRGIAERLAEQGARVVVSSRNLDACESIASELNDRYARDEEIAAATSYDIDHIDDVERLVGETMSRWAGVDILICNAGVLPFMGPSADTPPALFDRILISNQHHSFRLCQAVRPSMVRRGGGSIVLIGSVAGHTASPGVMAYAIAKAGISHMARCLADEFARDRIRVNCIAPGLIRSFSSRHLWQNEDTLETVEAGIPLGRIGEPDDVAGAVIFLCSEAGSFVTGATIPVDGGQAGLSAPNEESAVMSATEPGKTFN